MESVGAGVADRSFSHMSSVAQDLSLCDGVIADRHQCLKETCREASENDDYRL
jgi:hypothetical protein